MTRRNVYGNDFSENGWPMVNEGSCQWIAVPGTDVHLQIQIGIPLALLRAFAADFNAYVEPLRDADSACWTLGNSVATSNHLSGSACDLDWVSHPFRIINAGFNGVQIATIRELLAFYTLKGVQMIWWGNDWDNPKDAMHFQVGYNTYNNQDICNEFILTNIRPDGFSTFRRGNTIVTPDAALILSRSTGLSLDRATEILPTMQEGLRLAECTNPRRIAMCLVLDGRPPNHQLLLRSG
jgi:putative chitinase